MFCFKKSLTSALPGEIFTLNVSRVATEPSDGEVRIVTPKQKISKYPAFYMCCGKLSFDKTIPCYNIDSRY